MILIDALYINDGGGKVLLDYLISEAEKTDKKIIYLIDERIKGQIQNIKPTNEIRYLAPSFLKRRIFYKNNKNTFSTILCFANLPPNIKVNAKVYTYFHQALFLEVPNNISFNNRLLYRAKIFILKTISKNTNYWLVQSVLIKELLAKKYKINHDRILIKLFYPPFFSQNEKVERNRDTFLYVSNANTSKNHNTLIEAFCKFYDQTKRGKLILTVSKEFSEVYNLISEKVKQNYPIDNIGFVERDSLVKVYQSAEYLIYPSLTESFGLSLVEAIENGCKIIGADLPYIHMICKPSLIFNPYDINSIIDALSLSLQGDLPPSESIIKNNIQELIDLLK